VIGFAGIEVFENVWGIYADNSSNLVPAKLHGCVFLDARSVRELNMYFERPYFADSNGQSAEYKYQPYQSDKAYEYEDPNNNIPSFLDSVVIGHVFSPFIPPRPSRNNSLIARSG